MSRWGGFASGLAGVLVGALLMTAVPVLAGNGDPIYLGEKNTARRITKVSSKGGIVFRSVKAGNPAASFEVPEGEPPIAVGSSAMVENLNADFVDGYGPSSVVRVAYASTADGQDTSGDVLTTTIEAPYDGYLIMTGTMDGYWVDSGIADTYGCVLTVGVINVSGSSMHSTVGYAGSGHTSNDEESCTTTGVTAVSAGSHTVDLRLTGADGSMGLGNAALWALYVPFDANGNGYTPLLP